ncbi:MAG: hypothetical protein Q8S31_03630 [Alphaproteobacteria bacterium]|nr:hypothetical protein [Alphaproteobacteria bacterium]
MIRLAFVFLFSFFVNHAFSELPFEEIGGWKESIDEKYHQQISPLYGFVALNTYLPNLRFFGHYGTEKENIASYSFTFRSENDFPQDHVASFIQFLFPSFDRINFIPNQISRNPISKLSFVGIGKILREITLDDGKLSENLLKKINEILVEDIFSRKYMEFLKCYNSKKEKNRFLSSLDAFLETKSCKPIALFSRILLEALRETKEYTSYPKNVVEHTLLAFAWKKADKRADMEELVKAAGGLADINSNTNFNKDFYFSSKKKQKDEPGALDNEVFANPELASFFGYGHEIYENEYPLLITYGQAKFNECQFADCVETMIRNIFNILLYDNSSNRFEVDKLKNVEIKVKDELICFYTNYPTILLQKTQKARNDWATIVSNKENIEYVRNGYEMESGFINVVMLLQNCVPIVKYEINHDDDKNKKLSMARDYLSAFLHIFSDSKLGRQWSIQAKNEAFETDKLCIAVANNDSAVFNINIESRHASLEYDQKLNKNNNFSIEFLEKNIKNLDPNVFNLLLSSQKLFFLQKHGYQDRSEIVFSCNLYDSDEMVDIIDFVLSQKIDALYMFLNFWLSTLPTDDNHMKFTLYEIFKKNKFPVENYAIAAKIVHDIEAITKEEITSFRYADDYDDNDNDNDNDGSDSLLRVAVEENLINVVKEFLKKIDFDECFQGDLEDEKIYLLTFICRNNSFDMLESFINTGKITQDDMFKLDPAGDEMPFYHILAENNFKILDLIINSVGVDQNEFNGCVNELIYAIVENNNSEECLRRLIDAKILSKEQLIDFGDEKTDFLSLLSKNKECYGLLNYVINEIKIFSAKDFLNEYEPIDNAILKQNYNNFHEYLKIFGNILSDEKIIQYIMYFVKKNLDDEAVKCIDYFKINFKDRIKKILKIRNEKGHSVLDFLIISKNKRTLNHFMENLIFEPNDFINDDGVLYSSLDLASIVGDVDCLKIILKHSNIREVDMMRKNKDQKLPWELAYENGNYEAFSVLTQHAFNPSLLKKRLERGFEVCNEGEPVMKKSRQST